MCALQTISMYIYTCMLKHTIKQINLFKKKDPVRREWKLTLCGLFSSQTMHGMPINVNGSYRHRTYGKHAPILKPVMSLSITFCTVPSQGGAIPLMSRRVEHANQELYKVLTIYRYLKSFLVFQSW